MTEPTAEQIEAELGLAAEIDNAFQLYGERHAALWSAAKRLARVRIEAHTAGRNEGLREAESKIVCVHSLCDCADIALDAIRALRGRE